MPASTSRPANDDLACSALLPSSEVALNGSLGASSSFTTTSFSSLG